MRKTTVIVAGILLIAMLCSTALALGNTGISEESAKMTDVVLTSSSSPIPDDQAPQVDFSALNIDQLLSNQKENVIPENVVQKVNDVAKGMIKEAGFFRTIPIEKGDAGEYYLLLVVNSEGKDLENVEHFEAIVSKDSIEFVPLHPELKGSSSNQTVIAEYETNDEREMAKVIVDTTTKEYQLTLQNGRAVGWYSTSQTIEGKAVLGNTLWRLTAAGNFYCSGTYVYDAIDTSNIWAEGWLGWNVESFSHSLSFHPAFLWAQVDASGSFNGPFQHVNAWAWIRQYGDASYIGDGGTY